MQVKQKDMKKYIVFGIAFIGIITLFILIVGRKETRTPMAIPTPTQSVLPNISEYPRITGSNVTPLPTTTAGTIVIHDVPVRDFMSEAKPNDIGDMVVEENAEYQLVYQSRSKRFLLSILGTPFDSAQLSAEEGMLKTLGISKEDACWLGVMETTPSYANPEYAGKVFNPTFCDPDE
jgi:hypothetical protein